MKFAFIEPETDEFDKKVQQPASYIKNICNAIASLDGVTAAWKAEPTITAATNSAAGSIAGIIVLTSDTETAQVEINLSIAQLVKTDKEKVEEAKILAETAWWNEHQWWYWR